MVSFIYNFVFIPIALVALKIMMFTNKKVSNKEKNISNVNSKLSNVKKTKKRVWFHASSMGEFEQAKPVIESIKKMYDCEIVCSFYSPTGYENNKDYQYSDYNLYMPFDSKKKAAKFINLINPDLAVFVRYDIWLNHLNYLKNNKIPTVLINATKPNSKYTDYFGMKNYFKVCFSLFDMIFTVNDKQTSYFDALKIPSEIITTNDTRLNRIYDVVQDTKKNPLLRKDIFKDDFVIIVGSSWKEDFDYVMPAVKLLKREKRSVRIIFVPHEPDTEQVTYILASKYDFINFSTIEMIMSMDENHNFMIMKDLVVDSVGKLLRLYAVADVAIVGDGWGRGVHSVSEPAGYGIPLLSGPKISSMPDAVALNKLGGLKVVENSQEIYEFISAIMDNKDLYNKISQINRDYVANAKGTCDSIAKKIAKFIE